MKQTFRNALMSLIVCFVTKHWKDELLRGEHAWRTLITHGTISNGESFLKRETDVEALFETYFPYRRSAGASAAESRESEWRKIVRTRRGAVARTHFMPDLTSHLYTRTCMPMAMSVCNRSWRKVYYSTLLCLAYFDECTVFWVGIGLSLVFRLLWLLLVMQI